jgi:hypothetical protein
MSRDVDAIRWDLHSPPGEGRAPDWLVELSEMRGRVLFEEGRRPRFRLPSGTFADDDPLDRYAYHLIARASTRPIGCIRLVPLDVDATCVSEELVGESLLSGSLDLVRVRRRDAAECGRWIVPSQHRRRLVGMRLAAGIIAVGRWLGYRILIGPTGVRDGQASLLSRIGMRALPSLPQLHVPQYDDEIAVLYLFPAAVTGSFARVIDEMALTLKVEGPCSGEFESVHPMKCMDCVTW